MEKHPKRRKLMPSHNVAGADVVGSGVVLINEASVGGVVAAQRRGRGCGGGGGGGGTDGCRGGGGGGGGGGAMPAAVRGRTLPRTGGSCVQPENIGAGRDTTRRLNCASKIRPSESTAARNLRIRGKPTEAGGREARDDRNKENRRVTRERDKPSAKRERECDDGDAIDATAKGLRNTALRQQRHEALNPAARMAKNAGESRIPLPGALKPSLLPKPRAFGQPKVNVIPRKSFIISGCPNISGYNDVKTPDGKNSILTASTPAIGNLPREKSWSQSPIETVNESDIGKLVCLGKDVVGFLRFYGTLDGQKGIWCGIELPRPEGLNDGTVRGFKYFTCPPNHGIMAPVGKVNRLQEHSTFSPPVTEMLPDDKTFDTDNKATDPNAAPTITNPAPTGVTASGTFLLESDARADANFNDDGAALAPSGNTTFVAAAAAAVVGHAPGRPATNAKTSPNETRTLADENRRARSPKSATRKEKTPSPGSRGRTFSDETRTISLAKSPKSKNSCSAEAVSPGKPNNTFTVPTIDGTFVKGASPPTKNGLSPVKCGGTPKRNDTFTSRPRIDETANGSKLLTPGKLDKPLDVTYETKKSPEKAALSGIEELKKPLIETLAKIVPPPKPTGAVFTLNDTFINEKPTKRHANSAAPGSQLFESPAVKAPFAKKFSHLRGQGLLPNKVSVENKAFDLANATPEARAATVAVENTTFDLVDASEARAGPAIAGNNAEIDLANPIADESSVFVAVENKAFDLANAARDEKVFAGNGFDKFETPRKSHSSILDDEEMENSFMNICSPVGSSFLRNAKAENTVSEGDVASRMDDLMRSIAPKNSADRLNLTFDFSEEKQGVEGGPSDGARRTPERGCAVDRLVDLSVTFSTPRDGRANADLDLLSSTARESIELPNVFHDSKLSGIESMGSSCLLDVTSGPYSLLGVTGGDEEDELTPPAAPPPSKATPAPHYLMLNKQNSFEFDESLGILTPDQMTEFTMALECSRTPSCENLSGSGGSRLVLTRASASRPSDLPTSADGEPTEGSSERTPSPEELPLDPKPLSEPAGPIRTVPVSFVTSVTSITSLEAGYQGDGENSRPASRGADPPPLAPPPNLPPAPCRQDPMTDSDFFTESDADAHEEIVRGDRRAQVIDGTLFCAPGGRRCPSFTGEEMDSSGIYSDLDKRQDERHPEENRSEDQTPDTADTVSQKSQPSPNKPELDPVTMDCLEVPQSQNSADTSGDTTFAGSLDRTVIEVKKENSPAAKPLNKTDPCPLKKYKMPKRNVVPKIKAMIESGPKDEAEKEGRRPQRTPRKGGRWDAIMSKIEAGKNEQRSRPPKKEVKSRVLQSWAPSSSSSSSNAQRRSTGDANNKSKRRIRGRQDVNSPTQGTAHSSVHSSMSDISSAPRSAKKRLGSPAGGSEGSTQSTPRISSPRQQQPPSSLAVTSNSVGSNVATNNIANSHNNNNNGSVNNHNHSRASSHSQRSPATVNPPRRLANGRNNQQSRPNASEVKKSSSLDVSKINLEKSPSAARKPTVPRRLPSNVSPKLQRDTAPAKDRGTKETTANPVAIRGPVETRDQADQTDLTCETLYVARAEVSVQALAVIVQYLAHQLDGFSAPNLKKDCEKMKGEWLAARMEVEELRAGHSRIEERLHDEREDHRRALDQLREDLEARYVERIAELEAVLQEERNKFEERLAKSLSESEREHQAAVSRLRAEHEADLARKEADTDRRSVVHDQGAALRAEVESLRTVLELRSQEITALRSENDGFRREVEIKDALEQRVEALEARCEDLNAQLQRKESFERQLSHENKILLESFHQESTQKKRLSQQNEELQWRLRQNNEVVTVLANQLATPPQRLTRSLGPESMNHSNSSPGDSPPASPMVKSMVEKSDSVSWTLEIEETPEAMASRLLRRSGSTCRGVGPCDSRPKRPRQPASAPGAVSVSRQSSLRTTPQRAVVLRTRSKSVSVADSAPKDAWPPGFGSTPTAVRRRPRSDPTTNPGGVTAETSPSDLMSSPPTSRPQEAGGEAMISEETSASSSEDESSASSDIPRLAMEFSWSESEG